MSRRYDKTAFIAAYHQAYLEGRTAEQLAADLGVPSGTVHSRAHYLRDNGLRMPRLRRKLAAKPVQVREPTLGDELEFDTAFLHKPVKVVVHPPVSFTITITLEGVDAAV
jgi:hypothetical protein